jgi:hypothetical protein
VNQSNIGSFGEKFRRTSSPFLSLDYKRSKYGHMPIFSEGIACFQAFSDWMFANIGAAQDGL